MEMIIPILTAAVRSGTPILYATLGEILTEKGGILNLGLEGIMLMGAYTGFSVAYSTGSAWLGVAAAFLVGTLMGLVHAFICVSLKGNQVVSGLALTMFGTGQAPCSEETSSASPFPGFPGSAFLSSPTFR